MGRPTARGPPSAPAIPATRLWKVPMTSRGGLQRPSYIPDPRPSVGGPTTLIFRIQITSAFFVRPLQNCRPLPPPSTRRLAVKRNMSTLMRILDIHRSVSLSFCFCLSVYMFVCLYVGFFLCVFLSVFCEYVCLSICQVFFFSIFFVCPIRLPLFLLFLCM